MFQEMCYGSHEVLFKVQEKFGEDLKLIFFLMYEIFLDSN